MNTTTELRRCLYCGKERRAETLRVEKRRYASGAVNTRKMCPACQERRTPPQVMK